MDTPSSVQFLKLWSLKIQGNIFSHASYIHKTALIEARVIKNLPSDTQTIPIHKHIFPMGEKDSTQFFTWIVDIDHLSVWPFEDRNIFLVYISYST